VTAGVDGGLSMVLGGGVAAVVVTLGVAALLLGPGRAASPAAGAAAALSVPGGGGTSPGPASGSGPAGARWLPAAKDTVVVTLTNELQFEPDSVRIHRGETVVWENTSVLIHTSTDDPAQEAIEGDAVLPDGAKAWSSGRLEPRGSFARTFTIPGEYHYFCIPHEAAGMKGMIQVISGPE